MNKERKIISMAVGAFMLAGCADSVYRAGNRNTQVSLDLNNPSSAEVNKLLDVNCGPGVNGHFNYYDDGLDIAGGKRSKSFEIICDTPLRRSESLVAVQDAKNVLLPDEQGKGNNQYNQTESVIVGPVVAMPRQTAVYQDVYIQKTDPVRKTNQKKRENSPGEIILPRQISTVQIVEAVEPKKFFEHHGEGGYGNLPIAIGAGLIGLGDAASGALTGSPRTKFSSNPSLRGGDQNMKNYINVKTKQPWKK